MLLAADAEKSGSPGSLRELSIEPGDGWEQLRRRRLAFESGYVLQVNGSRCGAIIARL